MLDNNAITEISNIFIGDTENWYEYKSGPQLVEFFNQYFNVNEVYSKGFPSRWAYVAEHLKSLDESQKIDKFFEIILSKEYILSDSKVTEVKAVEKSNEIFNLFNRVLRPYSHNITRKGGVCRLAKINEDLKFYGAGGFANVYLQKSTGYIVKKLKEDYLSDSSIKSRFKREYDITESLQGIDTIIRVIDFDPDTMSYRMELADSTLEQFIQKNEINVDTKKLIICQILDAMELVHSKGVVHRDLSPTNIFITKGSVKLADFGLGKDLNDFTSHQTLTTNNVGQLWYCAPEQFMLLKDGNKRSDIFSLGRIINFIMTGQCQNSTHQFRMISEKATNENPDYRYSDAAEMKEALHKSIDYHSNSIKEEEIRKKINRAIFDAEVELYIYELSETSICEFLIKGERGFHAALLNFMTKDDRHALHVMKAIDNVYIDEAGRSFSAYDPFANFSYDVLNRKPNFSFTVNEIAANILNHIAYSVRRFSAQHKIESLLKVGLEPFIESVLEQS